MTENQYQTFHKQIGELMIEALETTIGEDKYVQNKVKVWDGHIAEKCLASYSKIKMPFKYIVMSVISSKTDGYDSLQFCSTSYWEEDKDFKCTVKWENQTVLCILTTYALSMF